ncbi:MAG: hypothetical protein JW902_18890 [Syntrophaceae bacterium]|nr:hypothetical protein [Syntrophaceae bacterium]
MFLDREMKSIQEAKNRLATCCELRRLLAHIEVQGIGGGARRTLSNLSLGLAVVEQLLALLRERK